MSRPSPSVQDWLAEIKQDSRSREIGIFFVHNGVVRGTTKSGAAIANVELTCDHKRLADLIAEAEAVPGIVGVRAWVNEGVLEVGEDMIYALVAGDVRKSVFGTWETLARRIRHEVVSQRETLAGA